MMPTGGTPPRDIRVSDRARPLAHSRGTLPKSWPTGVGGQYGVP